MTRTITIRARGGVGFLGLLTIAFIVLRLCGVINWSWWWVLAPSLIPLAAGLGFVVGCLIIIAIAHCCAR